MNTHTRFGPPSTPSTIRWLVIFTACSTLGIALLEALFVRGLGLTSPYLWTLVTGTAASSHFLWTPFTYFWTHFTPGIGISFNLLIELGFHMYLLWVFGTALWERLGDRAFLTLYLGASVAAGAVVLGLMFFFPMSGFAAGTTAGITAVAVMWVLCNPDAQLLLFFILPVPAKWLLVGALTATTLVNLSEGDLPNLLLYLVGALFGYLYGVIGYCMRSPFPATHDFDLWAARKWRGWKG